MMRLEELFETFAHSLVDEGATDSGKRSGVRTSFQWGGTVFAIVLLIINYMGRRSRHITTLLVLFLFTSFPKDLFKILRGQFGCWVAFLAILGNLFFPETFSVSRFLLFVITPDCLADGLRDTMGGILFCLEKVHSLMSKEIAGYTGKLYSVSASIDIIYSFYARV